MLDASAPEASASSIQPLSLLVAVLIMISGSINPFIFAGQQGGVDHAFASAIFWAMSAGLVHGVGFKPTFVLWRWLFSGWACLGSLVLAAWLRLG